MLYNLQVKSDKQRTWKKLSIKMRSIEALKRDANDYVVMYAKDNQLNHHTISHRIVDQNDNVVFLYESNSMANKGK